MRNSTKPETCTGKLFAGGGGALLIAVLFVFISTVSMAQFFKTATIPQTTYQKNPGPTPFYQLVENTGNDMFVETVNNITYELSVTVWDGFNPSMGWKYIDNKQPHALLMGMLIAGYIAGAQYGVIYIRAEYPESVHTLEKCIQTLVSSGFVGENILGTGYSFHFKIIQAQGAYICGEETALLSSIEGQRPEVRVRPPFPTQQGLFNLTHSSQ